MLNFDWTLEISAATAKAVFLVLYGLIAVAVWLLSDDYVLRSVADPRPWHNLKWWSTGVLLLLALIYLYF